MFQIIQQETYLKAESKNWKTLLIMPDFLDSIKDEEAVYEMNISTDT